jgi:hypothetical protein
LLSGHTGRVLVSEGTSTSTSIDSDFTADPQFNEFHLIKQDDLNDLIRDLDLSKCTVRVKTATMEPSERKCQIFCDRKSTKF